MKSKFIIVMLLCAVLASCAEASSLVASCTNGKFEGVLSDDVISWKGVPYAKAPVGSLRWKAPEAPEASTEEFKADSFSAIPIQVTSPTDQEYYLPQDEDCLYLNIWEASDDVNTLKPVMVWIHGGAFQGGGTASPYYDGQVFVKNNQDVIFVSVGYRLGLMGFIDFVNSSLTGAGDFPDSGNLGLLDMLQALKWLNNNIAAFGGDPDNITLFGQSSGAACISLLMSMEESNGLFRRAITESGAISMTQSKADSAELTQKLIELTGAASMSDLMALSSQDLLAAARSLSAYMNFPERDDRVLAEYPALSFAVNSGNFDLLLGTNKDEVKYWIPTVGGIEKFAQFVEAGYAQIVGGISQYLSSDAELAQQFIDLRSDLGTTGAKIEFCNDLLFRGPAISQADLHYASTLFGVRAKTYMYYWEYPSTVQGLGACHAAELPYVLNSKIYPLAQPLNQEHADKVQSMWVNFAKTGNPSTSSITWPAYTSGDRTTMIIGTNFELEDAPLDEQRELITPLLKYGISGREIINAAYSQQDTPEPESPDIEPEPEITSPDITPQSQLGSSGGGCNTGAIFIPSILYFFVKKRRA